MLTEIASEGAASRVQNGRRSLHQNPYVYDSQAYHEWKSGVLTLPNETDCQTHDPIEQIDMRDFLGVEVSKLTDRQQDIIHCVVECGQTPEKYAKKTKLPVEYVREQIKRSLAILRRKLEDLA